MTAITATVVGVVLSLAVFFARHTFWPQGLAAAPDGFAIALGSLALVALFRYQVGIVNVLCAAALGGLGWSFVR